MIKEAKLQTLAKEYGYVSSWAIWNPKDYTDISVIKTNHDKLLSNVVMVGLNVSDDIKEPWQNFHMGSNDRKLMKAFNDTSYRGAYMTDLIKSLPESNSKKVLDDLTDEQLADNFESFYEEMKMLGAGKHNTLFILFGNQVKELFLKGPIFYFNNIVCCMHYSYYGITVDEWIRQTHETLRKHYMKTKDIFDTDSFSVH